MSIMRRFTEDEYEAAIDSMMCMRKYLEEFVFSEGPDFTELLRLLLTRGLPLRTRDYRDDKLIDLYDEQAKTMRAEFEKYAHDFIPGKNVTRVDHYIDYCNMENAA